MSFDQGGSGNGAKVPDGSQRVHQFAEQASAQAEQARMIFEEVNERVRAFVRERPGAALIGAFAVGWAIGKVASKLSR